MKRRRQRWVSGNQQPHQTQNASAPSDDEHTQPKTQRADATKSIRESHNPDSSHNGGDAENKSNTRLQYWSVIISSIAALAALAAAGAGFYQAYIARHTEITSNRAIVISNGVRFVSYGSPGDKERWWDMAPSLENVGNTPTKNLRYHTALGSCPGNLTKLNDVAMNEGINWRNPMPLSSGLIGPKSAIPSVSIPILNVKIECPTAIVSRGVIAYQDIFENQHLVEFCNSVTGFSYKRISFDTYPAAPPIKLYGEPCPKHNCQDKECGPDWEDRAAAMMR